MPIEQHEHGEYATLKDLNGFGERVNRLQVAQGRMEVQTIQNCKDIGRTQDFVNENAKQVAVLERQIAVLVTKVSVMVALIVGVITAVAELLKTFLR